MNKPPDKQPARYRSLSDPATLRQFASKLGEGMYISTPSGDILDANQAFMDIVGVGSLEELRAVKTQDLMDPARRSEETALYESRGAVQSFEFELKRSACPRDRRAARPTPRANSPKQRVAQCEDLNNVQGLQAARSNGSDRLLRVFSRWL